jgi:hypothetical protein
MIVTKLRSAGSVLNKKEPRNRHIDLKKKDDISTRLDASLKKSLRLWEFRRGLAKVQLVLIQSC